MLPFVHILQTCGQSGETLKSIWWSGKENQMFGSNHTLILGIITWMPQADFDEFGMLLVNHGGRLRQLTGNPIGKKNWAVDV